MTKSQKTDYLRRMLQMNPLEQSTEIVALRCQFLKVENHSENLIDDSSSLFDRKEQTIKNLELLRKQFWVLKDEVLNQQIADIDIKNFPDLALALNRLQTVANHKDSFRRLKEHPECFESFYEQFCKLVVTSPGKLNETREPCLNTPPSEAWDFDYRDSSDYRKIVHIIEEDFPELYRLEQAWLRKLLVAKK
ncbi:MAG: hypothetical protein K0U86_12970 [Planctomycetes bacterium]|nr:hypothetical protein [Planctomycetota bacterium]MCH9777856.1 hypothetical protein [Planctomycetota bacterium]MCH9790567.1 hypothetical protein [Planctomycetota bacterium]